MNCAICKGYSIAEKTVDEQVRVGNDIVLVRLDIPVCAQCGERYYDRKAIQIIEHVRLRGRQHDLVMEEVGKIFRTQDTLYHPQQEWAA